MTRDEIEKEFEILYPIEGKLPAKHQTEDIIIKKWCLDFAEHILRVAEQKQPQPIITAPRDGSKFIGVEYGEDGSQNEFPCRWNGNWQSFQYINSKVPCTASPSHWMPLPKPPSGITGDAK
jgi:hypothetical protein